MRKRIYEIIEECLKSVKYIENPSLDDIFETEKECYERIATWIK